MLARDYPNPRITDVSYIKKVAVPNAPAYGRQGMRIAVQPMRNNSSFK